MGKSYWKFSRLRRQYQEPLGLDLWCCFCVFVCVCMSMSAVTVSCSPYCCVSVCRPVCVMCIQEMSPCIQQSKLGFPRYMYTTVDDVFTVNSLNSLRGFLVDVVRRTFPQLGNAAWTNPQSNELTRGPPDYSSALSSTGGVHIGARALHVLNLILFGYITRLYQLGKGG
jgi:hypothetical protein